MSLAQIAQEALALSAPERRRLIAQLVAADTEQNRDLITSLTTKIDDRRADNWVSLEDLNSRFKEGWSVQYRLFVDLEAVEFLAASNPSLRRKLLAHLTTIEGFPETNSDDFESDLKGRRIDIAIRSGCAIHYWIDFADTHVKVLKISAADRWNSRGDRSMNPPITRWLPDKNSRGARFVSKRPLATNFESGSFGSRRFIFSPSTRSASGEVPRLRGKVGRPSRGTRNSISLAMENKIPNSSAHFKKANPWTVFWSHERAVPIKISGCAKLRGPPIGAAKRHEYWINRATLRVRKFWSTSEGNLKPSVRLAFSNPVKENFEESLKNIEGKRTLFGWRKFFRRRGLPYEKIRNRSDQIIGWNRSRKGDFSLPNFCPIFLAKSGKKRHFVAI
jgi:hypothetical protein